MTDVRVVQGPNGTWTIDGVPGRLPTFRSLGAARRAAEAMMAATVRCAPVQRDRIRQPMRWYDSPVASSMWGDRS